MEILYFAAIVAAFVGGYYLLFKYPMYYNEYFEETYGQKAWSFWMSAIMFLFGVATAFEGSSSDAFVPLLIITIIICIAAIVLCIYKGVRVGASKTDIAQAVITQFLSAVAIFIIAAILICLLNKVSGKKKRK